MRDLTPLLRPKSIAMIGASSDPSRGNGRTLRYLIEGGFPGPLFAVNPVRTEVQGLRSFPCIAEVPRAVDCAIVALPAAAVLPALRQCAAAGVRSAIVFAGGFAETGDDGRRAQAEISQLCRETGLVVLGPNSLGAYDARCRSWMTFSSMFEQGFADGGRLGMVTQSGGWGSEARRRAAERGMSVVQWASTGNEADVDAAEVLHTMALDEDIDVILLYLEGVRDGQRLRSALEAARARRKPVVAIKVGRTAAGQAAAASHTAALTGEDRAFDALCRHHGVHRADSIDELLDVAYAALHGIAHGRLPRGPATAILSPSGGFAVHMTDQAIRLGLTLPPTPEPMRRSLSTLLPHAAVANPVDVTGQVLNDLPVFGTALSHLLEGPHYDSAAIFVGMAGAAPALREGWLAALEPAAAAHPGRWLAVSVLADPAMARRYEAAGIAVFEDTARMLNAQAALVRTVTAFDRPNAEQGPAPALAWPAGAASEVEAKALLATLGIASPAEFVCRSPAELEAACSQLPGAVAVKVVSADLPHKTEVGGVVLGVRGADAIRRAVEQIETRVRAARPQARIDGYLLAAMADEGTDCLVGLRVDPVLGPLVVFGAGGVMAEWLDDVAIRMAPVSPAEAQAMIAETRISRALRGWRGAPAADEAALAQAIAAVSRLALASGRLRDLEINPLRVLPAGQGVLALDALIT